MAASIPQQDGVFGQEQLASGNDPFSELLFVINTVLAQVNVATLVQVKAVHSNGRGAAVGTVDVQPLVNQTTGSGQAVPHTTIYGLPFFRAQGGSFAFIADPVVGDIGIALFCDRDISSVKAAAAQALPGSARRFSWSDGIYFGGWASKVAPTVAVIVDAAGCEITGSTKIDGNANLNSGVLQVNGTQVVGAQQPHIAFTPGGTNPDPVSQAAIQSILTLLIAHGLESP
jgi:hypothetical protein